MAKISVEGMKFYAYHGVYEEENLIGNNYVIDVHIHFDIEEAADSDDVSNTINYETVYTICDLEMKKRRKLLETIVLSIIGALKKQFKKMENVEVIIKKLHPGMGGIVEFTSVTEDVDLEKECAKCSSGMICYDDDDCWCRDHFIYPKTREMLKERYGGCLCEKCLTAFEK